jgi:hypothetical protein
MPSVIVADVDMGVHDGPCLDTIHLYENEQTFVTFRSILAYSPSAPNSGSWSGSVFLLIGIGYRR